MRQASAKPLDMRQRPLPKLEIFRTYKEGLTMEQVIHEVNEANRRGPDRLRIATNKELDLVLNNDSWKSIEDALPCWSGTMFAHGNLDVAFGGIIEYAHDRTDIRYVFPVPEEYRGTKNAILVCEHPDLSIEKDGKDRIIRAARVALLEGFPAENGWYPPDPRFGLPLGAELDDSSSEARYLWRRKKRVGLVARGFYDYNIGDNKRIVNLDCGPSYGFGVVVVREKKTELVWDGPDPYRSMPRAVLNPDEKPKLEPLDPVVPPAIENQGLLPRLRKALGF